jgi:outer membrane lipoprotein-sorting protein
VRRDCCYLFECVVALLAATFFLAGCAAHKPLRPGGVDGQSIPAAVELLSSLKTVNSSLVTFKGLGTVSLVQNGKLQKFRGAWAAAVPDKLRLQLFGPAGQPVFSIACDGRYYYLLSPEKESVVKQRVAATGLKRYIEIPIGVPDLLSLFCGRPPSSGTNPPVACFEKDALQRTALVLIDSSGEQVDMIYLNEETPSIREMERKNYDGELVWRALFEDIKILDNYRIPNRITLSAENEVTVRIDVEQFWVNPSISNDLFIINNP